MNSVSRSIAQSAASYSQKRRFNFKAWRCQSRLFVLALLLSQVLNACRVEQHSTLHIGISSWAGFDIVLYAQEAGFFKRRGLDVQLMRFENQQDSSRAVLRGSLDAAFTSLWDVMQTDSRNDKPAVILVTNISYGSDGIVAQPAIKSVKDLPGKRVGAKLGTVNHLILLEALNMYQIKPDEVQIEDISNETAVELMLKGKLDAAVIWQPLLGETAKKILGNVVFTTKELDSLVIDTLVSRTTTVREKQLELTQFALAWFDLMHAVETKPTEVFKVVGQKLGQSGESFRQDYTGLHKGDMAMQARMFKRERRLPEAIAQMAELLKADPRAGRIPRNDVDINTELVSKAMSGWKS